MAWEDHTSKYGLTKQEAKLFDVLVDGEIHSKADIIANAFDGRHSCNHLVPVHINRIRGKLKGTAASIISCGSVGVKFQGWKLVIEEAGA